MSGDKKRLNMLLVGVPEDVQDIIEEYKKRKKDECGCRFGNSQAVFNMLRKLRIMKNECTLQNGPGKNT